MERYREGRHVRRDTPHLYLALVSLLSSVIACVLQLWAYYDEGIASTQVAFAALAVATGLVFSTFFWGFFLVMSGDGIDSPHQISGNSRDTWVPQSPALYARHLRGAAGRRPATSWRRGCGDHHRIAVRAEPTAPSGMVRPKEDSVAQITAPRVHVDSLHRCQNERLATVSHVGSKRRSHSLLWKAVGPSSSQV